MSQIYVTLQTTDNSTGDDIVLADLGTFAREEDVTAHSMHMPKSVWIVMRNGETGVIKRQLLAGGCWCSLQTDPSREAVFRPDISVLVRERSDAQQAGHADHTARLSKAA